MNLIAILERDYDNNRLSKEDILIFYKYGILTEEQYNSIINKDTR